MKEIFQICWDLTNRLYNDGHLCVKGFSSYFGCPHVTHEARRHVAGSSFLITDQMKLIRSADFIQTFMMCLTSSVVFISSVQLIAQINKL